MLYCAVIGDHPLQRIGDVVQAGDVRAVGDSQGDDLDARGNAQVAGITRADQAGDGRAVLRGGCHRIAGAVGEIVAGDDLGAGPEAAAQGRIVVVDAGVDDGDGHAGAVDVVGRSGGGGADDGVVGGRRAGLDRSGRSLDVARSATCVHALGVSLSAVRCAAS